MQFFGEVKEDNIFCDVVVIFVDFWNQVILDLLGVLCINIYDVFNKV